GFPRRLELTGSNGTVRVEDDRVAFVGLHTPPDEGPPDGVGSQNPSASSATVSDAGGHRSILEDFLRAVESGGEPLCGGREGRRGVAAVEAIYRSAREGVPVTPA